MLVPSHHDPSGRSKRATAGTGNQRTPTLPATRTVQDSSEEYTRQEQCQSSAIDGTRVWETPPIASHAASRAATPTPAEEPHTTIPYAKLERLASLLESALATVITMQDQPQSSNSFPEHIVTVMSSLARRIFPSHQTNPIQPASNLQQTDTALTTLTTDSEQTHVCPTTTTNTTSRHHKDAHSPPVSSPSDQLEATAAGRGNTPPLSIPDPVPDPPHPTPIHPRPITAAERDPSSCRFLVLWPGKGPGPAGLKSPPEDLIHQLNWMYPDGVPTEKRFGGLRWTAAGHLALYIRAPYTTSEVLGTAKARQYIERITAMHCHGKPKLTCAESEGPWEHVVLNGLPVQGVTSDTFKKDLSAVLGDDAKHLRRVTVMCTDISMVQQTSVRLSFDDPSSADRLLRYGIDFHGQHIRTSKYRPRQRQSTPPPS